MGNLVSSVLRSASWPFVDKSPQQIDYRENWINAYRIHQFSENDHTFSRDL